jgi:hypothetical protein
MLAPIRRILAEAFIILGTHNLLGVMVQGANWIAGWRLSHRAPHGVLGQA